MSYRKPILLCKYNAIHFFSSTILASKFLQEDLNIFGKTGCLICILGAIVLIIHSPKEQQLNSMDELQTYIANPSKYYKVTM